MFVCMCGSCMDVVVMHMGVCVCVCMLKVGKGALRYLRPELISAVSNTHTHVSLVVAYAGN